MDNGHLSCKVIQLVRCLGEEVAPSISSTPRGRNAEAREKCGGEVGGRVDSPSAPEALDINPWG